MPIDPTQSEDEFIKLEEMRALKKHRKEAAAATAEADKVALKERHWMRCPKCGLELAEIDFKGVKVDACFGCSGMFLDNGEIDKILEQDEPGLLGRMQKTFFGS